MAERGTDSRNIKNSWLPEGKGVMVGEVVGKMTPTKPFRLQESAVMAHVR